MIQSISFKIDSDNDLYEITVDNKTYTLDNVYDSAHGELFDSLNILIDEIQWQNDIWQSVYDKMSYDRVTQCGILLTQK